MKARIYNNTAWQDLICEQAKKLATARNISLSGITTTPQPFDGSADVTIPVTAVPTSLITGILSEENLPVSSEAVSGILAIASSDEADAGTDNTKAITPAKMKAYVDANSAKITVSTEPPSGGNAGDLWIQIPQ